MCVCVCARVRHECAQNPENKKHSKAGGTKHSVEWTGLTAEGIAERCRAAADPGHGYPEPWRS